MLPQPSYAQAGSVYYICLLRDELLLHQGKAILSSRVPSDAQFQLFQCRRRFSEEKNTSPVYCFAPYAVPSCCHFMFVLF